MDDVLHANIMNALMLVAYVLILGVVFVLTRMVKYKARYVYELHLLLWRFRK